MRMAAFSLAAMALTLVATSGTALAHGKALAQVGGNCAAGSCWGTPGDDLMIGTPYSNGLHGLGGNDLIRGWDGDDFLTGDAGNDAVHGGSGDDKIEGNGGGDLVKGGRGNDLVVGGWGGDVLRGGRGSDLIVAQDGYADLISCGPGSGDLVIFDSYLDRVAADCEVPRARCPENKAARPTAQAAQAGYCGICCNKTCAQLRSLSTRGSCENKYHRRCT